MIQLLQHASLLLDFINNDTLPRNKQTHKQKQKKRNSFTNSVFSTGQAQRGKSQSSFFFSPSSSSTKPCQIVHSLARHTPFRGYHLTCMGKTMLSIPLQQSHLDWGLLFHMGYQCRINWEKQLERRFAAGLTILMASLLCPLPIPSPISKQSQLSSSLYTHLPSFSLRPS